MAPSLLSPPSLPSLTRAPGASCELSVGAIDGAIDAVDGAGDGAGDGAVDGGIDGAADGLGVVGADVVGAGDGWQVPP